MKFRWTLISDPLEAKALMDIGKYRDAKPTSVTRGEMVWVELNEAFRTWRDARAVSAKASVDLTKGE